MAEPPPILVLDAYLDERGGAENLARFLGGRPTRVVRLAHEPLAGAPTDAAAVLVTGSAASVRDDRPWIAPAERLLRAAVERDVPVLGVCFGHQLLARALLGPAAVRPAPTPELDWAEIEVLGADPLLAGLGPRFTTFVSHADEVVGLPPGWPVLARSARCAVQAFRVAGRRAWGVQFHAEMPRAEAEELVRTRAERLEAAGTGVEAVLARGVDGDAVGARLVAGFLCGAGLD